MKGMPSKSARISVLLFHSYSRIPTLKTERIFPLRFHSVHSDSYFLCSLISVQIKKIKRKFGKKKKTSAEQKYNTAATICRYGAPLQYYTCVHGGKIPCSLRQVFFAKNLSNLQKNHSRQYIKRIFFYITLLAKFGVITQDSLRVLWFLHAKTRQITPNFAKRVMLKKNLFFRVVA